jgi:hypothetical protein
VLKDWFHLRERCPTCDTALDERGEENDYYIGGMLLGDTAAVRPESGDE